uniref:Uncharacterized protein n=1 Tax=Onchocerca volvulus TaxID=6282 RepID=A0A8R1Y4H4_ONCVO
MQQQQSKLHKQTLSSAEKSAVQLLYFRQKLLRNKVCVCSPIDSLSANIVGNPVWKMEINYHCFNLRAVCSFYFLRFELRFQLSEEFPGANIHSPSLYMTACERSILFVKF